jgi:hypothetical protein
MTTPPEPDQPAVEVPARSRSDPLDQGLAVAGEIDVVPGDPPVPISVWRVAGTDHPARFDTGGGLTSRLAALLIGLYTGRGDTVVDLTSDPSIAGAAGAGARRYLPVDDPARLADLDHVAGAVRLVVLRWPPTRAGRRTNVDSAGTEELELTALLTGCRRLLAADGYTIVALIPAPHTGYVEHAGRLIPAARRAGLGYLQHIVAVTAPIPGARRPQLAVPADPATLRAATHLRFHLDLLVFVLHRTGRAAGPAR